MKLWGGRFSKATHGLVDAFNASIGFDHQLAPYDVQGSLAHAQMLADCGLIAPEEATLIIQGLTTIAADIKAGQVDFQLSDEDIHMNIERLLHERIGDVAGKLHTGRSRNDQVALDLHLYLRAKVKTIVQSLHDLMTVLQGLATDHVDTLMPGYTHLQRAEPIRLAHHLLAYFNMFNRDVHRLCDGYARANFSPLGAGALAGSGVAVDPLQVANALHFDGIYNNSLDAVSDRDFVVEFLAAASLIMMHLSKLSEELILWSSHEFSFIQFDDAFSTGSSMMPQKKNPDVCELARGKTGRVYGALMGLLTVLKGLPLAYNKDLQEDKESLFDAVNTVTTTLAVYAPMLATLRINTHILKQAMVNDYSNATNLANYLTQQGIPFRQAHAITGRIVLHCIEQNVLLQTLDLATYQGFSPKIKQDVYAILTPEAVVEAHQTPNGTAKHSVMLQLQQATLVLNDIDQWLEALPC